MSRPKVYRDLFDNDGAGPKLKSEIEGDYLPLSGGTMTGSATFGTSSGAIRRTVEDDVIELWGGSTTYCGKLGLFGQNSTTHPGEFRLYTYNSTNSNVRCLAGSRDGYLSWNGCFTTNTTNVVSFDRTKGSVPSESEYRALYFSSDQSLTYNKVLGAVETGVYADGGAGCYLFCLHNSTADLARAEIGCRVLANGTTQCYSNSVFMATSLQATSDIRKKTDIKEVAPDLSSIKTYEYVLKDDGKRHVGLIAQEVEKVLPTAVSEDDEGFKSLDYNSVVAALVGEVNALKKELAELKK